MGKVLLAGLSTVLVARFITQKTDMKKPTKERMMDWLLYFCVIFILVPLFLVAAAFCFGPGMQIPL